jgi:periplasmic protein TonB
MFVTDRRLRLGDADSLRGISSEKMKKDPKVDLRTQYTRAMEIAIIAAISLSIVAFRFFPDFHLTTKIKVGEQEIIEFEDIDHTRQEEKPPPPPRPPIAIEAPSDDVLDDLDFFSSELDLLEDVPPPAPPIADDEDEFGSYFVAVETMPEIIGGIQSLARNLVYPELARRAGVEGTVYILAYVDEQGVVRHTEIARGIGAGCDEAAAEAVSKARFKPGLQRGQPVKVRVMVPVRFSLRQSAAL